MSCGSPKRHAKLGVRMEVARMVLQAAPKDFDTMFPKVITAVCAGIDLDAEDAQGVARGDDAAAVIARNALLNAPLESAGGLDRAAVAKCVAAGIRSLGALVQMQGRDVVSRTALAMAEVESLDPDLARYGLALGMDANSIRDWILKGPA